MPPIKKPTPTLKGLFVNSHINRLREKKGEEAVKELERRYGSRVVFKNLEEIPVREEVRIIELCLALSNPAAAAAPDATELAGRLHYENFSQTGLGQVLLSSMPHTPQGFKTLVLNSGSIGRSVFKHTNFSTTENNGTLVVTMENTDYPLKHFEGFFSAWAEQYGLQPGSVSSKAEGTTHRYTISGF
ncbi:MAG: DUF2378 family protein [Patescibacteria group bacterium]